VRERRRASGDTHGPYSIDLGRVRIQCHQGAKGALVTKREALSITQPIVLVRGGAHLSCRKATVEVGYGLQRKQFTQASSPDSVDAISLG
jgi:hypothetical protein